jgi:uncharacterized protein YndB with AHSA1/START domain
MMAELASNTPIRTHDAEFRSERLSRRHPVAVVDLAAGMLLANAEVPGSPDVAFRALLTREVERWWTLPGVYHLRDWTADLRPCGRWSVTVVMRDGARLNEWGEVCHVDPPHVITLTRRCGENPLIGERETCLTYRFAPARNGTFITVRESGFVGRPAAACGNAENWERVLEWLDEYLGRQ